MYVACILHECCMYVKRMVHVCCMYVACMLHVCCMYAACMLHVYCMYIACMLHAARNRPVEASFDVYSDFENYASGVYQHSAGSQLGGRVRIFFCGRVRMPTADGRFQPGGHWDRPPLAIFRSTQTLGRHRRSLGFDKDARATRFGSSDGARTRALPIGRSVTACTHARTRARTHARTQRIHGTSSGVRMGISASNEAQTSATS
jgi:hypothetical protein